MPSATLELERIKTRMTKPELSIENPIKKTKLSSLETITGNKLDLVFVCQPDAEEDFPFYDHIMSILKEPINNKKIKIYSPYEDVKLGRHTSRNSVAHTVTNAIPRTKSVLLLLSTVTPEIQEMVNATYENNRPFLLMYPLDIEPLSQATLERIKDNPLKRGLITYKKDEEKEDELKEEYKVELRVKLRDLLRSQ